ncbi:MAG TPA: NUDIX hydrolase [Symbiobacteriaceae bacterium]|nr:NUDIX hydrolase [Symbiobacteriaceae bacterium]
MGLDTGFIQFRNPLPAVAVMITAVDRILLGRRSSKLEKNHWCMPCGFIEHDEDFLAAARREVKEETGLDVRPVELINVAFNFLTPKIHTLVTVLRAEVVGGSLLADDDTAEVTWFGPADPLPPLAFESDAYIIERYRVGLVQPMPVEG